MQQRRQQIVAELRFMSETELPPAKVLDSDAAFAAAAGRIHRKPDLETRIAAEEVRLLLDLGGSSRYTIFGAILIVGLTFYPTAPVWTTGIVVAIQAIAQIVFDRVRTGFRADPDACERALSWAQRYAAGTFISGMTWGIGGLLWLPGSSFAHHIFFALVLSVLSMATAISRATYPPAVIVYVSAACAPTLLMLLYFPELLSVATVALGLLFLFALFGWTRQMHKSYREAIRLRFENADLVERMARAHAATEQKRADAEEAKIRARAANRAKSEFLDILGHEVRTPLETLSHMAVQLHDEPLTETQHNLAQAMSASSEMLRRLFDDMIDFSQMEAGTLELKPRSFDPAELVKSVVRLMRPRAKERGLSLELDLVPSTPPTMIADPDRLRQVLVNLVSNAIKFTESGGVILRVQSAAVDAQTEGLRFSVIDTGIGLTESAKTRLFESFTQGDEHSEQERPGGMGLGLAVCDRLTRIMGGQIQVDSAAGQGSTFWFRLPREAGAIAAPQSAQKTPRLSPMQPDRLVDHDYLYELERELGVERTTERMVASLIRVVELLREIDRAKAARDVLALHNNAERLQREAREVGLVAVANVAQEIADAVKSGRAETAMHDVARLQPKISASWSVLAKSFPNISL